jgi:hypothetical protein
MYLSFVDELSKLAEQKEKKHAPSWLKKSVNFAGLAIGAGLGAATGDLVADKLTKTTNPTIRAAAKATGAGLSAAVAATVLPKLKDRVSELLRGE